jgi:hypothetical protein
MMTAEEIIRILECWPDNTEVCRSDGMLIVPVERLRPMPTGERMEGPTILVVE